MKLLLNYSGILIISLIIICCAYGYLDNYKPTVEPSLCVHDEKFQPDYVLVITLQRNFNYSCEFRDTVLVNGTYPGPLINVTEGDAVWVRVYNDMPVQNLTMHWHGLTLRTAPFSDGTPLVSQWPIPPGHYFDYEFKTFIGDAGTYFYHSHVHLSAITAAGPIVVTEKSPRQSPYYYDDERIILLTDAFHQSDDEIYAGVTSPHFTANLPDAIMFNAHARAANATFDQFSYNFCSHFTFNISAGLIYRFRIIGGMALSFVFFALENHDMTMIEADGRYISPVTVDHVEIGPGMRFSMLVKSKTKLELEQDRANLKRFYWIQAESRGAPLITTGYSVIQYDDMVLTPRELFDIPNPPPLVLPNETFAEGSPYFDLMEPFYIDNVLDFPTLEEVTRRVYVNIQEIWFPDNTSRIQYFEDGGPWFEETPVEPYLISLYTNNKDNIPDYDAAIANGGFDKKTKTWPAKIGEVLEVVWNMLGDNNTGQVEVHPMHGHGDHFYDVGTGYGVYDPVVNEAKIKGRRIGLRDTVMAYRSPPPFKSSDIGKSVTWRTWRIRVRNPGAWMYHCHILIHMMMGMNTVFVYGNGTDLTPVPKELVQGYLTYGGTAYGNSSYSPRVLHFWHDPL